MKIAILGATGMVGTALAVHLLKGHMLRPGDTLELCGHGTASTQLKLFAERADLLDAFHEAEVAITVEDACDRVTADIVVVAGGATIDPQHPKRRDLAEENRPIFQAVAEHCAARLPRASFLVVSNPIELAVDILAGATDRHRVLGMGAHQDSLRFARAVAEALGLNRRDVRATVLGEHGQAMVPLWSSVELLDDQPDTRARLAALAARCTPSTLAARVGALRARIAAPLQEGQIAAAYDATRRADPDARIFVEPFVTLHCLHSTAHATANAAAQVLAAMRAADGRRIAGQVKLQGEIYGVEGTVGAPLSVGPEGWRIAGPPALERAEAEALTASAAAVAGALA